MSDPWPPAFMRTAPPTDPGTPTAHDRPGPAGIGHPAGQDRAAPVAAPARTTAAAAATLGRPSRQLEPGETAAEMEHDPVEARVGHQQVGAAPDDEDRGPLPGRRSRRAARTAVEIGGALDLDVQRGRAPDAVGRQRTEGPVQHGPLAQRAGQCAARSARRRSPLRRPEQLVGQRGQVPRPQGEAEVARLRSTAPTAWRSSSQPGA